MESIKYKDSSSVSVPGFLPALNIQLLSTLLIIFFIQSAPLFSQSEGFVLYWKKQITPGPGYGVHEYIEDLVRSVGDQNGDGYCDFVVSTADSMVQFYAGGNPMDTIPFFQWKMSSQLYYFRTFDVNEDGNLDMLISYNKRNSRERLAIYLGGPGILDSIPDAILFAPLGARIESFGAYPFFADFNGDGNHELFSWCQNVYNTTNLNGTIMMHNIYQHPPYIDSLPTILFTGDTTYIRYYFEPKYGDFNGDGMTDIAVTSTVSGLADSLNHHIFLGNPEFDFTVDQVIKVSDYGTYGSWIDFNVLGDVNRDGRTDVIHPSFDNQFPYWYTDRISYGNFPLLLTGTVGLNTANTDATYAYMCGDINKDGYEDFIIRSVTNDYSQLYLGGHMNKLLPVMHFWGGDRSSLVPVGDVNGDGASDIGAFRLYTLMGVVVRGDMEIYLGDTTLVSVKDEPNQEIDTSSLELKAHPNPFNGQTTIRFKVIQDCQVTITVHNILGEMITKEVLSATQNTDFNYQLDAARLQLTSGMYVVSVELKDQSNGRKSRNSIKVQLVK